MPDSTLTNSRIVARYRARTPGSEVRAARAREMFPSGIVHDARKTDPYPLYVTRAQGSRKWDVDGNTYLDYYGGHGAMILGHGHPAVVAAVSRQASLGSHYAACSELEVAWGEWIKRLVPSAELVRFTSSGTEANLMAMRLARAFTGKPRIVRFLGHFHGWQDHVAFGVNNHFDGTPTPGVLDGIAENVLLASPHDINDVRHLIEGRDDIAAVIVEPTGANTGHVPMAQSFVTELAGLTRQRGVVLILDEVVTGFRVAPGGAQALFGIRPDLTSLAKIVAGGLPGGAVAGRREILELLDFEAAQKRGFEKITHQGTHNGNPLAAAAGIATLEIVAKGEACNRANRLAARLRDGFNRVLAEEGVAWAAYGTYSTFYVFTNPGRLAIAPESFEPLAHDYKQFKAAAADPVVTKLRLALLNEGVDLSGKVGGFLSAAHTDADVDETVAAFAKAIHALKEEGDLPAAARAARPV